MSGRKPLTRPPLAARRRGRPGRPPMPAWPGWPRRSTAGAQFVQTQYVFDVPAFARWVARGPATSGCTSGVGSWPGSGRCSSLRALQPSARRGAGRAHSGCHVARRLRASAGRADPSRGRAAVRRDDRRARPRFPASPGCTCWPSGTRAPSPASCGRPASPRRAAGGTERGGRDRRPRRRAAAPGRDGGLADGGGSAADGAAAPRTGRGSAEHAPAATSNAAGGRPHAH